MGHGVDEVREAGEGGRETDGGAVERDDEDLGMRVEGVRDEQVVGEEAPDQSLPGVDRRGGFARDANVGAAGGLSVFMEGAIDGLV